MTQQNKTVFIAIISILILWIIWWIVLQKPENTIEKTKEQNIQKNPESNVKMSVQEIKEKQIEKEKQYAKTIENENQFFNDALMALDESICEKIVQDMVLKQDCIDNVYLALSKEKNEMSYCMKIKDSTKSTNCKNLMYYDMAIKNTSNLYCNRIKNDESLIQNCNTNIILTTIETTDQKGDTKICESLIGSDKDYCMNRIKKSDDLVALRDAVEWNNWWECWQISDPDLKKKCLDVIYLETAINSKNITICNKIISSERKTQCQSALGKMQWEEYLQKAIEKNDITICNNIIDITTKNNCTDSLYIKKAYQEKNINYCNKIIDSKQKEICTSDLNLILKQK